MSKSLYQYRFDPEQKEQVEALLRQAIPQQGYKDTGKDNVFQAGSGWMTAKRRIQYKIVGNVLSICVWKVVAPIVPMAEMGCDNANSAYGVVLNSGMKNAVNNSVAKVSESCSITKLKDCETVEDAFLDKLSEAPLAE